MDLLARIVVCCMFSVTVSIVLTGCAGGTYCGCYPSLPNPIEIDQRAARGLIQVDASQLAPIDGEGSALERLPAIQYRHLTPIECQCLAARNAPLANVVELEMRLTNTATGIKHKSQSDQSIMRSLLRIRAIEERNRAAGDALETFYQLAEAEGKRDLLAKSMVEVDNAIALEKQMQDQGLFVDISKSNLQAQRLDLLGASAELNRGIEQLNGKLRFVLHFDPDDLSPIWPDVDLTPRAETIDMDRAISEGLESRSDLAGLRMMRDTLNESTLSMIEQSMNGLGMVLAADGVKTSRLNPFTKRAIDDEIQLRRRQLNELYYHRTRGAAEEIRQAVGGVETAIRKVSLSAEKVAQLKSRHEKLVKLRETGDTTPADISKSSFDILQAEGDLLRDAIQWKIAQAKLRETQGILAMECDYTLPSPRCR